MKQAKIFGGICAAVAMLVGAGAAYAELKTIGTFTVQRGRDGKDGNSMKLSGTVATCAELNALTNVQAGDMYLVTEADNKGFVYDGSAFPSCPDKGVKIQGVNGCTPDISVSPKSDGCFTITVTPYTLANDSCVAGTPVTRNTCDGEAGPEGPQGPGCNAQVTVTECGPDKTAKCTDATRSGVKVRVTDCNNENPTEEEVYDAQNSCDTASEADKPNTTKDEKKVYVAPNILSPQGYSTTFGYYQVTTVYCDGHQSTDNKRDDCTLIIPDQYKNVCVNGTYYNCINRQDRTPYRVCDPLEDEDAMPVSAFAASLAEQIDENKTNIGKKLDTDTAANTYLNKDDAAATYANKDNVISKDATFSKKDGYIVLTDGDTTKNVVALSDIQGESPCPGGFVMSEPTFNASDNSDTYTVYCKTEKD